MALLLEAPAAAPTSGRAERTLRLVSAPFEIGDFAAYHGFVNTTDGSLGAALDLGLGGSVRLLATLHAAGDLTPSGEPLPLDYGDLGPPWVLSYSDTIVDLGGPAAYDDSRFVLLDDRGMATGFDERAPGVYEPAGETRSPHLRLRQIDAGTFEEDQEGGVVKTYERLDPAEDRWRLVRVEDPAGSDLEIFHENGQMTRIASGGGGWVELVRAGFAGSSESPQVVGSVLSSAGGRLELAYEGGLLVGIRTAGYNSGLEFEYASASAGQILLRELSARGLGLLRVDWTEGEDGRPRVEAVTTREGTSRFRYAPAERRTEVSGPGPGAWSYLYDGAGRTIAVVDPAGRELSRTFDVKGEIGSWSDATGREWTADGPGRLRRILDRPGKGAAGEVAQFRKRLSRLRGRAVEWVPASAGSGDLGCPSGTTEATTLCCVCTEITFGDSDCDCEECTVCEDCAGVSHPCRRQEIMPPPPQGWPGSGSVGGGGGGTPQPPGSDPCARLPCTLGCSVTSGGSQVWPADTTSYHASISGSCEGTPQWQLDPGQAGSSASAAGDFAVCWAAPGTAAVYFTGVTGRLVNPANAGSCVSQQVVSCPAVTVSACSPSIGPAPLLLCPGQVGFYGATAGPSGVEFDWTVDGLPHGSGPSTSVAFSAPGAHTVEVEASRDGCQSVSCGGASVVTTVPSPVQILQQPQNVTAPSGGSATFSVLAAGSVQQYLWTKNGAPIGGNGPVLTLGNLQPSDGGSIIRVVILGPCNSQASAPATLTVEVTTKDVVVITWVDANAINLEALEAAANPDLSDHLNTPLLCGILVGQWGGGDRELVFSEADRNYANAFLLHRSANPPPPSFINADAEEGEGDWRMFNRFKVVIRHGGGPPQLEALPQSTALTGNTPDPCGLIPEWFPLWRAPEVHPQNGAYGVRPSGTVYQLNEARLGSFGQAVDLTLNDCVPPPVPGDPCQNYSQAVGHTTPWIWSAIRFDPAGNRLALDRQIFPTYSVYEDGVLIEQWPQTVPETFIALDESSQRLVTQIP